MKSAAPVRCTMVSLPAFTFVEDPAAFCATTTYSAEFPRCEPSSAAVRRLNRIIERRCREAADYDRAAEAAPKRPAKTRVGCDDIPLEVSGECEMPYQVGSALSFKCRGYWGGLRSGSDPFSINVDIAHGRLTELRLNDLLEAGSEERFWSLVRTDLLQQEVLDQEGVTEREGGPLEASDPSVNLTPRALVVDFGFHFSGSRYVTVELPYSALDHVLKPRYMPRSAPPNQRQQRTR